MAVCIMKSVVINFATVEL